jgi:hypothetical protein
MSLSQQIADVITITNRADLVAETTLAVKQATLKLHHLDNFPRDLFEVSFACATSDYQQLVDYQALLSARFRSISWMRKLDFSSGLNMGEPFDIIDPEQSLDSYGADKTEVVYLSGNLWKIRTSEPWQYFSVGYYLDPDVTDSGYSSWIDGLIPHAISTEAARIVFKMIGKDEDSAKYDILSLESKAEVVRVGEQLRGY